MNTPPSTDPAYLAHRLRGLSKKHFGEHQFDSRQEMISLFELLEKYPEGSPEIDIECRKHGVLLLRHGRIRLAYKELLERLKKEE